MTPDTVTAWTESIGGVIRKLGELGLEVNLIVMIVVFVLMVVIKRVDRQAWARAGKKRGARPGDNGYLVAWYPAIPLALGALCGAGWWTLVDGGTLGAAVVSGIASGALMSLAFAVVKSLVKYRRLLAKLKAENRG